MSKKTLLSLFAAIVLQVLTFVVLNHQTTLNNYSMELLIDFSWHFHLVPFIIDFGGGAWIYSPLYYLIATTIITGFIRFNGIIVGLIFKK